ncbi:MAG: metalloregulator ArsR/SmtB family transcription factor [Alphaproteobacteria bacterium]|nr:metalloregulator ArsR/SmtB family transcription factor [Alphaproteobacteria bacterium]
MAPDTLPDVVIDKQLPAHIMARAARGISYISHPTRLRILEFLDVHGMSSVSAIARGVNVDQMIVSQHLKKMRDAHLVHTTRRGIFVYYEIGAEYPASIFICLRKLFGYMTDQLKFLRDDYREILPTDYTTMAANRIKLFAHVDKMRILEYLTYAGESCVCDIARATKIPQVKMSQYLRKLSDDDFVTSRRDGRFVYYTITPGVHKTTIGCIHKRYDRVGDAF